MLPCRARRCLHVSAGVVACDAHRHLHAHPAAQVWAVPPSEMQCGWLGERVATVDVSRAIANVVHGREDAGWGPNATFRFPKRGGSGAVWRGVARLLPSDKQVGGPAPVAQPAGCLHAVFGPHLPSAKPTTTPNTPSHRSPRYILFHVKRYRTRVVGLDAAAKRVTLASGDVIQYGKLLSTVPLDVLLRWAGRPELGEGLHHSSTHVVGVGVRGKW